MTLVVNALRPAFVLVAFVSLLAGCERHPKPIQLSGGVYGTGWHLTYIPDINTPPPEQVQASLEAAFDIVNVGMNSYDPESTISRFNRAPSGEVVEVDWDFAYVFNEARRITELTDGAYDVTVTPLLALWGFGPEGPESFPEQSAIDQALGMVGLEHLEWSPATRELSKLTPGVSLELSSIAKGYGVDLGADALDELGIDNFMLDVGGEIQLRGMSPRGDAWRIAIERPEAGDRRVQTAIALSNTGVATSGDYRNYFERAGKRYSHLIDPRTGYPIAHDLVSVTVVHGSTAVADAWATALCVVGAEKALALAEERHLAIYTIRRDGDELIAQWSEAFEPYLASVGPSS